MANVELLGWSGGCECIHNNMAKMKPLHYYGIRNLAGNHRNNQIHFGFESTTNYFLQSSQKAKCNVKSE